MQSLRQIIIDSEQGLADFMQHLPTSEGDCSAIAKLLKDSTHVLGSDGLAVYSEVATFAVKIA